MKIVGERPGWILFDRDKSNKGWVSLKLVSERRQGEGKRKRNFWLGWNGERLARTADAKSLIEREPEIHAWVLDCLQSHPIMRAIAIEADYTPRPSISQGAP